MVELDQFKYTLGTYKQPLEEIKDSLDLVNKEQRVQELERKMEEPDFWDNPEKSQESMKTLKSLKDDIAIYHHLTELFEDVEIPGFMYHKLFAVRSMKPKERVFAATTAWHLYVWYRDNQFCGRCAHPLVHSRTERMLQCPVCNNMVFPKIAPAVIIGLTNNDQIMMTKYAGREYKRYALIAGFTEIGETAEETVHREVMEEVGLKVKNIRYYKSQPWGFDSNLLMGFFCDLAEEGEIRLEEEELSLAEWVDYRDVPDDPEGLSLTREMMTYFRKQREQGLNP